MKLIIKSGYTFTLNHIRKVRDIISFQSGKFNIDLSSFSPKLNDYGSLFGLLVCELGFICLIVGAVADTFSPQISFLNQALIFCAFTTLSGCLLMFLFSRYYVALRIYRSINGIN